MSSLVIEDATLNLLVVHEQALIDLMEEEFDMGRMLNTTFTSKQFHFIFE